MFKIIKNNTLNIRKSNAKMQMIPMESRNIHQFKYMTHLFYTFQKPQKHQSKNIILQSQNTLQHTKQNNHQQMNPMMR